LYLSSGADDVTRLEPLGALQQIELHGFALVQRAVPILLDGGEMNEDIFPCGPLDKTISFSPVKPLYCTLLSHNKLLSPLLRLEIHILREARAYLTPSKPVDDFGFALQCDREPGSTRKAPEFRAVVEKRHEAPEPVVVARVSTTICKTSTQANERRCRYSGNGRNNIQELSFWQEKN
jgi:hypothetical protein